MLSFPISWIAPRYRAPDQVPVSLRALTWESLRARLYPLAAADWYQNLIYTGIVEGVLINSTR